MTAFHTRVDRRTHCAPLERPHWIAKVGCQTATLISLGGTELVNGTTYKVEIDVKDSVAIKFKRRLPSLPNPKSDTFFPQSVMKDDRILTTFEGQSSFPLVGI